MKPITNLMTLYFIYCLYSRDIVFENICILDLARTAMILQTAKSLFVHRLRRLDVQRWWLMPSESFELADLFPSATVIDLESCLSAEGCIPT